VGAEPRAVAGHGAGVDSQGMGDPVGRVPFPAGAQHRPGGADVAPGGAERDEELAEAQPVAQPEDGGRVRVVRPGSVGPGKIDALTRMPDEERAARLDAQLGLHGGDQPRDVEAHGPRFGAAREGKVGGVRIHARRYVASADTCLRRQVSGARPEGRKGPSRHRAGAPSGSAAPKLCDG